MSPGHPPPPPPPVPAHMEFLDAKERATIENRLLMMGNELTRISAEAFLTRQLAEKLDQKMDLLMEGQKSDRAASVRARRVLADAAKFLAEKLGVL